MPLITPPYANALYNGFIAERDNRDFADTVAGETSSFANNGLAVIIGDPYQTKRNLACTPEPYASNIYVGCMNMNAMGSGGDEYMADLLAAELHDMCASGAAGLVFSGDRGTLYSGFINIFRTMYTMLRGGDRYFADQAASIVNSYLTQAGVT